jgi:hypothetical protein
MGLPISQRLILQNDSLHLFARRISRGAIVDGTDADQLSLIYTGGKFGYAVTEGLGEVQDACKNKSSQ